MNLGFNYFALYFPFHPEEKVEILSLSLSVPSIFNVL